MAEVLSTVGLSPPEQYMDKYPSDLSGGQKQRAVIARSIVLNPSLLVADEPVSMLDMSVRAKILELMLYLKRELDLTYLYITHDLATAKFFCDRIAILYLGRIVEIGPSDVIYEDPKHPYTKALLRAIPEPDPRRSVPRDLPRGEVPDAARPPRGCSFHPRCPAAFEVCGWEPRDLGDLLEARWALQPEVEYEAERAIVGDLSTLEAAETSVRLKPTEKAGGAALGRLLETIRADDPDNPFWTGRPADRRGRESRRSRDVRASGAETARASARRGSSVTSSTTTRSRRHESASSSASRPDVGTKG